MIEIDVDATALDTAMRRLEKVPYALQRAAMPAVHEMMQGVAARLVDYLQSDVPLPAKYAKGAVRMSGVSLDGNTVTGEIKVKSAYIPLIDYDVKPADITARGGIPSSRWPGFTYALRAEDRRRSEDLIRGAGLPFIARMPGGHLGVYFRPGYQSGVRKSGMWGKGRRGTKAHAAIKQLYGPDAQYHVANPAVVDSIRAEAADSFPVILSRYVEHALEEFGGGA